MTLSVYHSRLSLDNSSSAPNPRHPFSRRLLHPPLARRGDHRTQQLQKPEARLRKPRVHGIGGE